MSDSNSKRRRRRPAVSCTLCRKRKVRCNREIPCSNCIRSKVEDCIYEDFPSYPQRRFEGQAQSDGIDQYEDPQEPQEPQEPHHLMPVEHPSNTSQRSIALAPSSTTASTPASQSYFQDLESMKSRIRQLEQQLSQVTHQSSQSPNPDSSSRTWPATTGIAASFQIRQSGALGPADGLTRGIMHKTRLHGQSHKSNVFSLFQDIFDTFVPIVYDETSKLNVGIQRCKTLAQIIKSRLHPPWPFPAQEDLPSKDLADELIDHYISTSEAFYRVLHIPTFKRDYDTIWLSGTQPDMAFLIQLKLVLAIGAITYDKHFSLRSSAIRWIYQAQTWLANPEFKARLNIMSLQNSILTLIAREMVGVGVGFGWISAGSVLRIAMSMGFHRDPVHLPRMSLLTAEMRRRLWNTILEISLQSCMDAGGPPLISLGDFDTKPPANFEEDQLMVEQSVPKKECDFTQMSVAIALRKTFPVRLAIARFLNDLSPHVSYEETLRIDADFRKSYKILRQTLQGSEQRTSRKLSRFELLAVDFIMRSYTTSLHMPFYGPALSESTYAFSRKVVVENSLQIWHTAYQSSPEANPQTNTDLASSSQSKFFRLITCASGFYRMVASQAGFLMAAEIKAQLQEEESLGPAFIRPDLLSVLEEAKAWGVQSVEAGDTHVKSHLMFFAIYSKIDGIRKGLPKDEISSHMIRASEEALDIYLPILERRVALGQSEITTDETNQISLDIAPDLMEDWDFMMTDPQFISMI